VVERYEPEQTLDAMILEPKRFSGLLGLLLLVPKFGDFRESSNFLLVSAAIRIVRRLV